MQSSEDGSHVRLILWFDIAMPASGARTQIAVERAGCDLPLCRLRACWIGASYDRINAYSTFLAARFVRAVIKMGDTHCLSGGSADGRPL